MFPIIGLLGLLGLFPTKADAAYQPLTLRLDHHIFTIDADHYPAWRELAETWSYNGRPVKPAAALRVDGDTVPPLPPGIVRSQLQGWNRRAIAETLQKVIGKPLHRDAGSVTIKRSGSGTIIFDGVGMLGRSVDMEDLVDLVIAGSEAGVTDIEIPIEEIQPTIIVEDRELSALGIKEVVTVGESDFSGSPLPRRHNIGVGMSKFNGAVIPQGETFSFNKILGKVDGTTGYWKELVIMGEHTLPEYGGGLCQVSTTAYRGIWEHGFPIVNRRNHSFAVSYYGPQGTDATIYPPHTDMKFANDGPSALLIQTHVTGNKAYFIYYGTKDARQTEVMGPYLWDFREPPPDREEFTTEIPPGERRKASDQHPGVKALWFRTVKPPEGEMTEERIFSAYEARGLLFQTGIAPEPPLEEIPDDNPRRRTRRVELPST
ncbi:VanW family protein [Candidatus Peregrinibacteria bacterium]|nr:VanW family protein [Candidatus Peregrinibacteria bacterium]